MLLENDLGGKMKYSYAQWYLKVVKFASVIRHLFKQRNLLKESGRNPLTYHLGHLKICQNKPLENLTQ